jgi:hypothetical protein
MASVTALPKQTRLNGSADACSDPVRGDLLTSPSVPATFAVERRAPGRATLAASPVNGGRPARAPRFSPEAIIARIQEWERVSKPGVAKCPNRPPL